MKGSTTREGTAEWEEEWVMCSCNLCKWQKKRRRRIALDHIKHHGEFDRQLFDEARRHGTVIHDVHAQYIYICVWDGLSCNRIRYCHEYIRVLIVHVFFHREQMLIYLHIYQ